MGGTALARTHLRDGRLSEDIDLISLDPRRSALAADLDTQHSTDPNSDRTADSTGRRRTVPQVRTHRREPRRRTVRTVWSHLRPYSTATRAGT
ncbi:nucleotidyl transferase AbiEii/AbiGii toxin family protein [Rhodococcus sp. NCIMB 12038]|uniref:nucleotidyl transferase AbiEii/AbiGii toxin family protein n=1 Tax=Rhodococcus sp. NCIMB 12038 TaxID=933800 RepID=UPI00211B5245|nr:nucleotidyl transferase AbiEii/AbiGii toxin family protein [Rhodococcus sp. NCIMB 12038]